MYPDQALTFLFISKAFSWAWLSLFQIQYDRNLFLFHLFLKIIMIIFYSYNTLI
ncbi:unnamed protein product [Brugia timori]|uniref:Uncharacterized protein n=1 Tax=Brugia timori TaxID=42155 RepID=A0A3P7T6Q5_9BILA|nr:unnamed protein product [Brugia timori]